jgi:hypothetical protein
VIRTRRSQASRNAAKAMRARLLDPSFETI